jgi:secondary thiamine-phosphate synthase enzyme
VWQQRIIVLRPRNRGFHLITNELIQQLPQIKTVEVGLLHLFIQHTSASLTVNENADPTVRTDFEAHINQLIPEDCPYFSHTYEGPDDMPAHIKSSLLGSEITIPIGQGKLLLGTKQLCYPSQACQNQS